MREKIKSMLKEFGTSLFRLSKFSKEKLVQILLELNFSACSKNKALIKYQKQCPKMPTSQCFLCVRVGKKVNSPHQRKCINTCLQL